MVYITNTESSSITVLNGFTNNIIKTIEVEDTPWRIDVEPDTNMIYVTNTNPGVVSVIDGVTNTLLQNINVMSPYDISVDSKTNKVYVTTLATLVELDGHKNEIEPPKKQFLKGVLSNDIICKPELKLIFKTSDNSPACVTPQSAEKLVTRGWGNFSSSTFQ